nr:hypothetical protein CparaKRNrm3_p122 [Cryptomonas paramecium]
MQNVCFFTTFLTKKFMLFVILTEMIVIENFFHTRLVSLPRLLYKLSYSNEYIVKDSLIIVFQKTLSCMFNHIPDIFKYKSDLFFLLLCYKIKRKNFVCNTRIRFVLAIFFWKLLRNMKKKNMKTLYSMRKFNKIDLFSTKSNICVLFIKNDKDNDNFLSKKSELVTRLCLVKKILSNHRYLYMKKNLILLNRRFQIIDFYINKKCENIKNILKEGNLLYQLSTFFSKKFVLAKQISLKKAQLVYFTKIFIFDMNVVDLRQFKLFCIKCTKIFKQNKIYYLKKKLHMHFQLLFFVSEKIFNVCFHKNIVLLSNIPSLPSCFIYLLTKLFMEIISVKHGKFCEYIELYNINYIFLRKKSYLTEKKLFFLKNIVNYKKKTENLFLNFLKAEFFTEFKLKYAYTFSNKNGIFQKRFYHVYFHPDNFSDFFYRKNCHFAKIKKKILLLNFCLYDLILNIQTYFSKKKLYTLIMLNIYIRFEDTVIFLFLIYLLSATKIIINVFKFRYFSLNTYIKQRTLNAIVFEKSRLKLFCLLKTIMNYFINKFSMAIVCNLVGVFLVLKQEKHRLGFVFCQFQVNGIEKKGSYNRIHSNRLLNSVNIFLKEKNELFCKKKKKEIHTKIKLLKKNLPANSFVIKSLY